MRQLVNGCDSWGIGGITGRCPRPQRSPKPRTRLGEAPLKLLFERIAVPMARPGTRGAWFHGLSVSTLTANPSATATAEAMSVVTLGRARDHYKNYVRRMKEIDI